MLLISEYSFEMAFNNKYKQQDYDYFQEMVGAEQHKGAVINLHKVYLSMMIELEKDLHVLTNDDMSLAREIDSLLDKIKSKLSTDLNELFPEVHIGEKYLESFHSTPPKNLNSPN